MSNINNGLNGISWVEAPQPVEEGYNSYESQERYLTALKTDVTYVIAMCVEVMSMFVNFKQFVRLQERYGARFPRYLRINDTMPTRGSDTSYVPSVDFDRPGFYDRPTVWMTSALKKSLWEMRVAENMPKEQYNAEYERIIKSFVQFMFQECVLQIFLSMKMEHFQFYGDTLIAEMMVNQFKGINVFSTRGEEPSDELKKIINSICTNIENYGAVLIGHDQVISTLSLMTETKYESAIDLLLAKMAEYRTLTFTQGFLDESRQLLMNRLPTVSVQNVTRDKFISTLALTPLAIVPLDQFSENVQVCAAGAPNSRLWELFVDGDDAGVFDGTTAQTTYKLTEATKPIAGDIKTRRKNSEKNAKKLITKGLKYIAFVLPETGISGYTLGTAVLPTDKNIMPVTLWLTELQSGPDESNQGGTTEDVIRQPICAGNSNFQGTFTYPVAQFVGREDPAPDNMPLKIWQSGKYARQKVLLTDNDYNVLTSTKYAQDGIFFKHIGLDGTVESVALKEKLFAAGRFQSLTSAKIEFEYAGRGVDDVLCPLHFHASRYYLSQVPYCVAVVDATLNTITSISTTDENTMLHACLMKKPKQGKKKDEIVDAGSFQNAVPF